MTKGYIEVTDSVQKLVYQMWIDNHVPNDPQRLCRGASEDMCEAFPELRVVGMSMWGMSEHAWCVNKSMEVVDPTAHQFEGGRTTYDKKPMELTDFPKGKCMNCGELIYPDTPRNREIFGDETDLGPHEHCNKMLAEEFSNYKMEGCKLHL